MAEDTRANPMSYSLSIALMVHNRCSTVPNIWVDCAYGGAVISYLDGFSTGNRPSSPTLRRAAVTSL